jgi:hypothetical protein
MASLLKIVEIGDCLGLAFGDDVMVALKRGIDDGAVLETRDDTVFISTASTRSPRRKEQQQPVA